MRVGLKTKSYSIHACYANRAWAKLVMDKKNLTFTSDPHPRMKSKGPCPEVYVHN